MTKRLITEVAGVVTAPVEQVWQALLGERPAHDHCVYSVAGPYWAVALANQLFIGFPERTRRSFAEGISRIANQLGCSARLT
ncbi:hypothetical protein [Nonomuraea turcica]|uniref:hypothetical protein n=1 Tax=Nonomuraea sp. G32 TaxID=3067274 RepID=UPI00273B30FB|nr:hypothetical protein [Nonomuraea sp. G32]MDP4504068.1 hypothetical protein [Nonomuraea sp. G32]